MNEDNTQEMRAVARAMVAAPKGILAADESTGTIGKRFDMIGLPNVEQNRRKWRELMFSSEGIERYISGVILYDETIRQSDSAGQSFAELLTQKGILVGIKVDQSTITLAKTKQEKATAGLDGLRERLQEYRALGAKFTKWRAVITIGKGIPSRYCISINARDLARYAALSQECGLVPIVEPEVLMDGEHSIERCFDVTIQTLRKVFIELALNRVELDQMVLKPNMVISAANAPNRASASEVAQATLDVFARVLPPILPGIAFLSGGQGDEEATVNLDAINRLATERQLPWPLTYSYGRGLQATPLQAWGGKDENVATAQAEFLKRCDESSRARMGQYA